MKPELLMGEERHRMGIIAYDMYHTGGMRQPIIAKELGLTIGQCTAIISEVRRDKRAEERLKQVALFVPPKKHVKKDKRGLVTPVQSHFEAPLEERGRFLDSEEGQDTLERYNQPYEASRPEALSFRSPPENPLLTYGGVDG